MTFCGICDNVKIMKINSVCMIGMGAVGAVVGKNLSTVLGKNNLYCIAQGERLERYKTQGIFINGKRQNFNFIEPKDAKAVDLIIIATKNLQLNEVLPQIKNAVGKNTVILSLLNGIQSEIDIAKVYGEEKVLYSFIVGLSSVNENNNIICSDSGTIVFGEKSNEKTERIKAIEELFTDSSQKCRISANIQLDLWKKYLMNVTCNTITALCRSPYGAFNFEELNSLVRDAAKEVIAVANAEGIALTEQMCEDNINIMHTIDPKGKTSMFQDVEARRKTENEWFCGTVVELAQKHGIKTPICSILQRLIAISELSWKI